MKNARTNRSPTRTPRRSAACSSSPVARAAKPPGVRYSQTSAANATMTITMNAIGMNPTLLSRKLVNPELIGPSGWGRSHSEIPSRMLNIASVAMIDDSFEPADQDHVDRADRQRHADHGEHAEDELPPRPIRREHERGDDHAHRHQRADRDVERPHHQRARLTHRREGERHRGDEQTVEVELRRERRLPVVGVQRRERRSAPASPGSAASARGAAGARCRVAGYWRHRRSGGLTSARRSPR